MELLCAAGAVWKLVHMKKRRGSISASRAQSRHRFYCFTLPIHQAEFKDFGGRDSGYSGQPQPVVSIVWFDDGDEVFRFSPATYGELRGFLDALLMN